MRLLGRKDMNIFSDFMDVGVKD